MTSEEFQAMVVQVMQGLNSRVEALEQRLDQAPAIETTNQFVSTCLPPISEIHNCELTFYDNDRKQGRPRHRIQAEITTAIDTEFTKRDHTCFADMYEPVELRAKLNKRAISEEYKDQIIALLNLIDQQRDAALVGMFGIRGGKKGQTWFDQQFIIVYHNGDYKPLYSLLSIGGQAIQISDFKQKHPITNKPFLSDKIKGKSIDTFKKSEDDEA